MTKEEVLPLTVPASKRASMTSEKAALASANASVSDRSKSDAKAGPNNGHSAVGPKSWAMVWESSERLAVIRRYVLDILF